MPNGDLRQDDPTPSLDALIRMKRLERPSAETMEAIERGFRLRQIAISVPRRRWWHEMPKFNLRRALVSIGGLATVSAAVVAMLAPPRLVQQPLPVSTPPHRLAETIVYAPAQERTAAQPVVARAEANAPVEESAFVMDVLHRSAPAEDRFTTLAAPETLSSERTEEYVVFTLSGPSNGGRF